MSDKLKGYRIHPAAALFPLMSEAELKELSSDIAKHGLIHPIVQHAGAILDGRNRLIACKMADVLPEFKDWTVCGSPTEWVLSVNLHRRHLTQSQKAVVATDSLPLFEAEAKARLQKAGGDNRAGVEKIPQAEQGKARDKAAAAVGVNPRYVSDAKKIKEESPEVFEKVRSGEMTIPQAKKSIIRPIPEPQLSASEKQVIEAAEKDSEALWLLKDAWKKTNKKEKQQFNTWAGLIYDNKK